MENRKKDDYKFIKEVIKKKPVDKRAVLIRLASLVGSAVLFGLVAAFVFVQFLPVLEEKNQKPAQVEFEDDDPQVTPSVTPEVTPQTSGEENRKEPSNTDGELSLSEYRGVFAQMNDIAQNAMRSMVTVTGITSSEDWFNTTTESTKQSSGLIVADNGQELFILTEYRAVDTVDRVMVTFYDNTIVDGRYQRHDSNTGLTVVKVDLEDVEDSTRKNIAVAQLGNSYLIRQGETLIAIGSPMGYSNSVANGQVTSVTNKITSTDVEYNLLTTNILGSNSGSGVLITLDGEVIGIISQQFASSDKSVITGLPVSQLKSMIEILSNNGAIPYLGIQGQTVTAEIAKQTGMPRGIYVSVVDMDSPALQAGIQNADILIKYDGDEIENMSSYQEKLRKAQVGQEITLTVMRKGAEGYVEFEFPVTVSAQ